MELNNIFSSMNTDDGVSIVQIVEKLNKPKMSEFDAYCGVCINEIEELPKQEIKICESDKVQQLTNADPPLDNQMTCTWPVVTSATELDISFDDIGALGDIKEELLNLVMLPFCHPELHKGRLRTPCKGILLFGPPGCGKTMLAKAIAKETNASFINAFEDHDMSEWLGAEKSKMNELFRRASEFSPSILFLDNIDTVLQTLKSEFVACWDKFMAYERICVIVATRHPYNLDGAIVCRLERRIMVGLQNLEDRQLILKALLSKEEVRDIDYTELGRSTMGFSGKDLENLCRAAAHQSLLEFHKVAAVLSDDEKLFVPVLTMQHFRASYTKVAASIGTFPTDRAYMDEIEQWRLEYAGGGRPREYNSMYI